MSQNSVEPINWSALNHISLKTKRVEESIAFYKTVLGFRQVERPNFDFRGAWLVRNGLMIHLIENPTAGDPSENIDSRDFHFALHADDLDAAEKRLISLGIRYRRKLQAGKGIPQLFLHDPDGNTIEIANCLAIPPFID
jgi:catechol 2,3-dioxygenase-like lactoylglutathione lyase family enzyme